MSAFASSDDRLPLYQRLRDQMHEKIASGEWRPDEPIPTETELAQTHAIAVGTVRKAVDTLVAEGLLNRSQGRGTFVRRPQFDGSFFRFFRQVTAAGEHKVPESRILSHSLEAPPAAVRKALALEPGEAVVWLERVRMVNGHRVVREDIWLPASKFKKLLDVSPGAFGNLLYPFYEEICGQAVASATENLTVETADANTARALGIEPGLPVVVIERTALGYNRAPLEYRVSRGAAEGFRYQIDIF